MIELSGNIRSRGYEVNMRPFTSLTSTNARAKVNFRDRVWVGRCCILRIYVIVHSQPPAIKVRSTAISNFTPTRQLCQDPPDSPTSLANIEFVDASSTFSSNETNDAERERTGRHEELGTKRRAFSSLRGSGMSL
mgnify:CR=1 FL=1